MRTPSGTTWIGELLKVCAFSARLPDAAERLDVSYPWDDDLHVRTEAKLDQAARWAAKNRRRKQREAARRHLDNADVGVLLMVLIKEGPISLTYAATVVFAETDPGTGRRRLDLDRPSDDETKGMETEQARLEREKEEAELERKRDAARKYVQNSLIPRLRDDWGFVIEWRVTEPNEHHGIQNGFRLLNDGTEVARPLKKGQIVLEATESARKLFESIREPIKNDVVRLLESI